MECVRKGYIWILYVLVVYIINVVYKKRKLKFLGKYMYLIFIM